jgi:tetratricopeptide (TPR) repeat protein
LDLARNFRQKMAKTSGPPRTTDNLLQVAGFLRQADKLVRERNYALALDQIAKARAKDPKNSYAEAYEQRVMLLVSALKENKQPNKNSKDFISETPASFSRHLESIANLAILEAHRTANVSLQQECPQQPNVDARIVSRNPPIRIPSSEKQTLQETDHQVLECIHLAQELFFKGKLDESLNMLAPAILLDPLNPVILELERRIHHSQELEIVSRLSETKAHDIESQKYHHEGSLEIQKCIVRATRLTERKEFSQALLVIGHGYLFDPFSEPLATCEKTILSELARETLDIDSGSPSIRLEKSEDSEKKKDILRYLNNAGELLDEDRFTESLSQVAMAMIAVQHKESLRDNESKMENPVERLTPKSQDHDDPQTVTGHIENENSRNIFGLLDKAKQLASNEEYEGALDILLKASYVVPSNGSLDHLNREISRNFMEYFLLSRKERTKRTIAIQPSPDSFTAREPNSQTSVNNEVKTNVKSAGAVQNKQVDLDDLEFQFEFDDPLSESPQDRITQIRDHLIRSLRHLDQMHFVEASVEGEIAALVDHSRKDVASFSSMVSALAHMARSRTPLSTLEEQYTLARIDATELIQRLCYEEIIGGIDRVVQAIPMNNCLLKRRKEVERSLEEFEKSSAHSVSYSSKRSGTTIAKSRKRTIDQMGLTFDGGADSDDDLEVSRPDESEEVAGGIPIQKSTRTRSPKSSASQYLGL